MNIAPPTHLVSTGIYAISSHPIYLGFCLACAGFSFAFASAAGLWVITPLVSAGCLALVWGYERHDLLARFGPGYLAYRPLLALPAPATVPGQKPTLRDRLSIYLTVILPWLALYELTALIPVSSNAKTTFLPFEQHLPVLTWTELVYASAYLGTLLTPLLINRQDTLRRFALEGRWGTLIGIWCFIVFPFIAPAKPFPLNSFAGQLLNLERSMDPSWGNALPSFHGFWALLCASMLAKRSRLWACLGWTWALAIIISCLTTGMHSLLDMAGGIALFLLVRNLPWLYARMLKVSEHLANSYHYWRIGPIRIISHALWSFFAGALGGLLIALFAGNLAATTLVALGTLLGGMLWAQFIEGSPRLLRPFGYYGAIIGGILACLACPLVHVHPLVILAAASAAAPFIQAIGRIRCLVQGCCHGKPTSHGIAVTNPSSRVCALAHLDGVAIHPTQLYSILANLLAGGLLVRLYFAAAAPTLIVGLYLALAGLSRFVEESYRGEPQTRRWHHLPEYQWYAILSTLLGCLVLSLPCSIPTPTAQFTPALLWLSPLLGMITMLMMSVDFPDSQTRFARLTG